MRVYCQCGKRAIVSRSESAESCAELYCSCSDPECGHTFVSALGYKHSTKPSKIQLGFGARSNGTKITCGCGAPAIINKTNRLSNDCADLYCECSNPACGHKFVMSLYYSHTLSPSAKTTNELSNALIKALTPQSREHVFQQLSLF